MDSVFKKYQCAMEEFNRNVTQLFSGTPSLHKDANYRNINVINVEQSSEKYDSVRKTYAFSHRKYSTKKETRNIEKSETEINAFNLYDFRKVFNPYNPIVNKAYNNLNSSQYRPFKYCNENKNGTNRLNQIDRKEPNKTTFRYNREHVCLNIEIKDNSIKSTDDNKLTDKITDPTFNPVVITDKKKNRKTTREKIRHLKSQLGPKYSVTGYPHFCKYINSYSIPKSTLVISVRKVCSVKGCRRDDRHDTDEQKVDEITDSDRQTSIISKVLQNKLFGNSARLLLLDKYNIAKFKNMLTFENSSSKKLLKTLDAFSDCKHSKNLYIAFLENKNIISNENKYISKRDVTQMNSITVIDNLDSYRNHSCVKLISRSDCGCIGDIPIFLANCTDEKWHRNCVKKLTIEKKNTTIRGAKFNHLGSDGIITFRKGDSKIDRTTTNISYKKDKMLHREMTKKLCRRKKSNIVSCQKSKTIFKQLSSKVNMRNEENLSDLTEIDSNYYTRIENDSKFKYHHTLTGLVRPQVSENLKEYEYEAVEKFELGNSSVDISENNESNFEIQNPTSVIVPMKMEDDVKRIALMYNDYFDEIKRAVCENIGRTPFKPRRKVKLFNLEGNSNENPKTSENNESNLTKRMIMKQENFNSCGILKDAAKKSYKFDATPCRDYSNKKISFATASSLLKDQELETEMSSTSYHITETLANLQNGHIYNRIDRSISNCDLDLMSKSLIPTASVSSQALTSSTSFNRFIKTCSNDASNQCPTANSNVGRSLYEKCTRTIDNTKVGQEYFNAHCSYSTDTDRSSKIFDSCIRNCLQKVPKSYKSNHKKPPAKLLTCNPAPCVPMKPHVVKSPYQLPAFNPQKCPCNVPCYVKLPCHLPCDPVSHSVQDSCQLPNSVSTQSSPSHSESTISNQCVQTTVSNTSPGLTPDTGESIEIIIPKFGLMLPNNQGGKVSDVILLSGNNESTSKFEVIKKIGDSSEVTNAQINGTESQDMISPDIQKYSNVPLNSVNETKITSEERGSPGCIEVDKISEFITGGKHKSCIRRDKLVLLLKDLINKLKNKSTKYETSDDETDENAKSNIKNEGNSCKKNMKNYNEIKNTTRYEDSDLESEKETYAENNIACGCEKNKNDKININNSAKQDIKIKDNETYREISTSIVKGENENIEEGPAYYECDDNTTNEPQAPESLKKVKKLLKPIKVCCREPTKKPVVKKSNSVNEQSKIVTETESELESGTESETELKQESNPEAELKIEPVKKENVKKNSKILPSCKHRVKIDKFTDKDGCVQRSCNIQSFFKDLAGIMFERGCENGKKMNKHKGNHCSCEDDIETKIVICELMPDDLECPNMCVMSTDAVNVDGQPALVNKILKPPRDTAIDNCELIAKCKKFFNTRLRGITDRCKPITSKNLHYSYPQCEVPPCDTGVCYAGNQVHARFSNPQIKSLCPQRCDVQCNGPHTGEPCAVVDPHSDCDSFKAGKTSRAFPQKMFSKSKNTNDCNENRCPSSNSTTDSALEDYQYKDENHCKPTSLETDSRCCPKHVFCRNLLLEAALWPTDQDSKMYRFAEAGVGCNLKFCQTSTQTAS